MPVARIYSTLIHFAHVLERASMSIEHYQPTQFGPLALIDNKFGKTPKVSRWSHTSPNHMKEAQT